MKSVIDSTYKWAQLCSSQTILSTFYSWESWGTEAGKKLARGDSTILYEQYGFNPKAEWFQSMCFLIRILLSAQSLDLSFTSTRHSKCFRELLPLQILGLLLRLLAALSCSKHHTPTPDLPLRQSGLCYQGYTPQLGTPGWLWHTAIHRGPQIKDFTKLITGTVTHWSVTVFILHLSRSYLRDPKSAVAHWWAELESSWPMVWYM